ncbi:M3 family oligoendopeptidase [Falsibacillus pallidus]|uniref:M3 family oligoendopeptidase n=1 Tax=Falsibacillus pallidus TaxID=493781 RepID=UPI003D953735
MEIVDEKFARIDMDEYERTFENLLQKFNQASTPQDQGEWFMKLNDHRFVFETSLNYVRLQHYRDMKDEFFVQEFLAFTKMEPRYLKLVGDYYKTILAATYRDFLEERWGKQLFHLAELKQGSYSDEIKEELEKENQLMMEYHELLGKAETTFLDKNMKLVNLTPYLNSSDRETRKNAYKAKYEFFQKNEKRFDKILDDLVNVRNTMAQKLGYPSFVEMGYQRMNRTSHSPEDLKKYRSQIETYGVPFISGLRKSQKQRIGVDRLKFFDEGYLFAETPPSPIGSHQEILNNLQTLFTDLSPETKEFYEEMLKKDLIDLSSRPNKRGGNFATYIGRDKNPYIYVNFHGISNDIRVFTHEAGHAFQFFMSRHWNIPEYILPYDSAELFSFTMERLAWPWMEDFFGEDTNRYYYSHLIIAFMYMPLASAVDEFEHFLYELPDKSIEERKSKWAELEHKYLPERDYDGNEFLERGTGFYEIGHLFTTPFYFMDYDLAHLCSVQLWKKHQENPQEAVMSYLELCRYGGKLPFKELIKAANVHSPFEENSVKHILKFVEEWIEQAELNMS